MIFGLVLIESGIRVYLMIKNNGELSFLKNPGPIMKDKYRSFCQYSSILGYVPIKNAHLKLDMKDWNFAKITINNLGFRNGIHQDIDMQAPILVAGDSFVFGNQVSDDETWPACLQKKGYNVFNLGMGGYGTAQSLLRLKIFIENNKIHPKYIILQTLVGHDFIRDTLDFRTGFPSTALYKENTGEINYYCPDKNEIDIKGSKYSSLDIEKNIFIKMSQYSHAMKLLFENQIVLYQKQLTRKYDHSLTKEEIIDFVLEEFKKLPYQKFFLLQYGGDDTVTSNSERHYLLDKLEELGVPYIDTYRATRKNNKVMKELYTGHHTAKGNRIIADYIFSTGLLN